MRKIIHVDMAAFYASVEQRDDPEGQIQRLRDDYPQQVGTRCGFEPRGTRTPIGRISERYGVPVNTIKTWIRRALLEVRASVQNEVTSMC